jgi:hypothetical protein
VQLASSRKKDDIMEETPTVQGADIGTAEPGMREYVDAALMQTEQLRKILRILQRGGDLPLTAWHEAFDASHRTIEHINKAITLAQEVFDGHIEQVSGALSEDVLCDEFQCLTWK